MIEDIIWRAEIWLKQFYAGEPLDMIQSEKVYKLLNDIESLHKQTTEPLTPKYEREPQGVVKQEV